MTRPTPLAAALLFALAAGPLHAEETDLRFSGRAEAMVTRFGDDYYRCWNDGVAANCRMHPVKVLGDNYARLDGSRELNDVYTLVFRGQVGLYLNSAWYTRTAAANGTDATVSSSYSSRPAPATWTDLEDTWVGVRHERFGTVRAGRGVNPRLNAMVGDGTTDLGGREVLETMVAYDSPYLIGDKGYGLRFDYSHYQGTHMRKEIKEWGPGENVRRNVPVGDVLMVDAAMGSLDLRASYYREGFTAREWAISGRLDGHYKSASDLSPDITNGARQHAHGWSALGTYDFSQLRLGLSYSENEMDKVAMTNPLFPSIGYKSKHATLFTSGWHGRWGLWFRATAMRFTIDADALQPPGGNDYDWVYSNFTYDALIWGGELSYEFMKDTRVVMGFDRKHMNFKESPGGAGMCRSGGSRPCYDLRASKVFAGLRTNF